MGTVWLVTRVKQKQVKNWIPVQIAKIIQTWIAKLQVILNYQRNIITRGLIIIIWSKLIHKLVVELYQIRVTQKAISTISLGSHIQKYNR